jgi:malonate transporter and related proteins
VTLIIDALLPIFVTLLLGYLAAWHHDQDTASSNVLNKMVMTYTLPLSLFAGTVTMSRDQLAGDLPMAAAMLAGLAIPFAAALAITRYVFRRGLGESTLQALGISFPAVPFIGLPVLGTMFGVQSATLTVAISGLVTNLLIVPASIILLTLATAGIQHAKPVQAATPHNGTPRQCSKSKARGVQPRTAVIVWSSLKEPVVWAPILAILFVALGVTLPKLLVTSLQLLGSTTSGVSLFASGIILRALTPTVSIPIVVSTVLRLAVVPALAFFVFPLAGVTGKAWSDSVVALAMPCAVMLIILSVRYKIAERESASVLFYSYLFSGVSMTFAVLLTT